MPKLSKNEDGAVDVLPCVDLETGEEGLLLLNTVVASALTRAPNGYVGECFQLEDVGIDPDKGYRRVEVYAIEEDESDGSAVDEATDTEN